MGPGQGPEWGVCHERAVCVQRCGLSSLNFAASAGNGQASDFLTLPGEPTIIREEQRFSSDGAGHLDEFKDACNQCPSTGTQRRLCVSVPDNEVIIPNSGDYKTFQTGPGARLTPTFGSEDIDVKSVYFHRVSAHQVCLNASTTVDANTSVWCGVGYLTARVLLPVARDRDASGRPQDPNKTLSCTPGVRPTD